MVALSTTDLQDPTCGTAGGARARKVVSESCLVLGHRQPRTQSPTPGIENKQRRKTWEETGVRGCPHAWLSQWVSGSHVHDFPSWGVSGPHVCLGCPRGWVDEQLDGDEEDGTDQRAPQTPRPSPTLEELPGLIKGQP